VDGSVSDDMPAKRLARLYGVNHYIVSQTNPHVIPFIRDSKRRQDALSLIRDAGIRTARAWYNVGANALEKPLSLSPSLQKYNTIALSIINQDYVGDINILPPNKFFNPFKLLAYRSVSEVIELIENGEKATWPKIEMIRNQTLISRTLDFILGGFEEKHMQHVKAALRRKAG
jgi:NTE family protein